jgi:tight adherence protein C
MDVNIYMIFGTVFVAGFCVFMFFAMPTISRNRRKKSLGRLDKYDDLKKGEDKKPSIIKSSFVPAFKKILGGMRKILPKNLIESVKQRLELAGIQDVLRIDVFLAIKFFFPFVFLFLLIFLTLFFTIPPLLRVALVLFVPITYIFPDYYLKGKTAKRQDEIRRHLPNALDLLTISVEAGLGFDQALFKVSKNIKGPLGIEFKRTLKEMELGASRREALKNLSKRTDVEELNTFIFSIIQADIFGISVGKVLRVQSKEMRIKRRQIAEEKGIKAPVKLVFPTILFLFPALMVVVLGPAALRMWETIKIIMK